MFRLIAEEDYNKICKEYPKIKDMDLEISVDSISEFDVQSHLDALKDYACVDVSRFNDDELDIIDKDFIKYISENKQLITDDMFGHITDTITSLYKEYIDKLCLDDAVINLISTYENINIDSKDIKIIFNYDNIMIVQHKSCVYYISIHNNLKEIKLLSNECIDISICKYHSAFVILLTDRLYRFTSYMVNNLELIPCELFETIDIK